MRNEHACEPLDFLERQQGRVRQKLVVLVKDFARHAVDAAKLQRSVIEMRKSRKWRASVSVTSPDGDAATPEKSGIALMSARGMMCRDMDARGDGSCFRML